VKVAKPAKITDSLITAQSKARIPMITARIPVKKKLGMIVMGRFAFSNGAGRQVI
jgi:hypothetical protein